MRLFFAGATGVIGRQLLPLLVREGYVVTAMTRSQARAEEIARHGAIPVVCDVFEARALREAVAASKPDVVIHQLTRIPRRIRPRHVAEDLAATNRLRSEGTGALVEAARAAGARRFLSQSVAFAYKPGGAVSATEEEPLFDDGPSEYAPIVEAVQACERLTLDTPDLDGTVLRYGYFYGPGTIYAQDGSFAEDVARRRVPIIGDGGGVFSFVHVKDAAEATLAALKRGTGGIYNIVDDEPAPVHTWLPHYAALLGARRPYRVPRFLARILAGRYAVDLMTQQRGASNAKVRDKLGWRPSYTSWRDGFGAELSMA